MPKTKRYPALIILTLGGLFVPYAIVILGVLLAVKNQDTGSFDTLVSLFPVQAQLTSMASLTGIFALIALSVFRPNPMKWWLAVILVVVVFVLSMAGFIGAASASVPLAPEARQLPETLYRRIIESQIAFGIAVSAVLVVRLLLSDHATNPEGGSP